MEYIVLNPAESTYEIVSVPEEFEGRTGPELIAKDKGLVAGNFVGTAPKFQVITCNEKVIASTIGLFPGRSYKDDHDADLANLERENEMDFVDGVEVAEADLNDEDTFHNSLHKVLGS